MYLSKMESDGRLNMNCYPSGEYESYIQAMLPACGELQDDGSVETIDDQSGQDGAVVISTTTTLRPSTMSTPRRASFLPSP